MAFLSEDTADIGQLVADLDAGATAEKPPLATELVGGVPIYDIGDGASLGPQERREFLSEWAEVLETGAGALALRGAVSDLGAIDDATGVFNKIIADEVISSGGGADHFAAAGSNSRIWNSAQKLCLSAPDVFARYHASPAIDAVCEAWLGPAYQMTAQVNLVRPGGKAQEAHRDYHLGFQTADRAAQYPAHMHALSPALTLQGAIAHCDMPIESGPTKLLPHSQKWLPGYVAMRRADVRELFEQRFVQLPLKKGDALFFSPALFHAAGDNVSADIERMANLLQISSGMGRAMENLDRSAMVTALYPVLKSLGLGPAQRHAVIAAAAEGYPFPTNLDNDPPVGGLAPESQAELFHRALNEGMDVGDLETALNDQDRRRLA